MLLKQTFNALITWSLTLSACACPTVLLCALSVTQQCEITHWWFRLNVIPLYPPRLSSHAWSQCFSASRCKWRETWQQAAVPPEGPRSLPRGQSPRLATSCLTSLRRAEHAERRITRAGRKQSHFLSQIGRETERELERGRERVLASICHLLRLLPALSRSLCLSVLFISLLTIHPGPDGPAPALGTKYSLAILFQTSSHTPPFEDMTHIGLNRAWMRRFFMCGASQKAGVV